MDTTLVENGREKLLKLTGFISVSFHKLNRGNKDINLSTKVVVSNCKQTPLSCGWVVLSHQYQTNYG
ncbi:hypothetical protein BJP37_07050 [Moorena bouillonii PNG]|uniref:Uncharacterized protein n=1 Tax=Moorena bouillonii PNG TaxID=568701 RepID=A0A1U7MYX1_9CYAN|nr:hypothetical protein BJP37_07050 [Moorena bouillonii PNG]